MTVAIARETVSDARKEAYQKGVADAEQLTEQAYRHGYIDGSRLRRTGADL
jgi:hypothetical protein